MKIKDIVWLLKDLTVIECNRKNSPILLLNSNDYKRFYEDFKDFEE